MWFLLLLLLWVLYVYVKKNYYYDHFLSDLAAGLGVCGFVFSAVVDFDFDIVAALDLSKEINLIRWTHVQFLIFNYSSVNKQVQWNELRWKASLSLSYRFDDGVVAEAVIVLVDFTCVFVFVWFCCFFGLAGGVFFGDLLGRPLNDALEPRLTNGVLLTAPVFVCGVLLEKLFWRGGVQPK